MRAPIPITLDTLDSALQWSSAGAPFEYQAAPKLEVVLVRYRNVGSSVFDVVWQLVSKVALH